jgi:hypothetical protein
MASQILYQTASAGTCFWHCLLLSISDCKTRSDHAAQDRHGHSRVGQSEEAAATERSSLDTFAGSLFAEHNLCVALQCWLSAGCVFRLDSFSCSSMACGWVRGPEGLVAAGGIS